MFCCIVCVSVLRCLVMSIIVLQYSEVLRRLVKKVVVIHRGKVQ